MKLFFLLQLLIIHYLIGLSQHSGVATYSISYGHTELNDNNAQLYFKGHTSFFETSAGLNNTFSLVLDDTLKSSPHRLSNTIANQNQVFTNLLENKLITSNQLFLEQTYYTLEKPKSIKWIIHNQFKIIEKYKCQKATGIFRGRKYTAWFTKEIPVEFGPWKFNGLPGLIVEVIEQNDHVHILLKSFQSPYNYEIVQLIADKYITVSEYLAIFKTDVLDLTPDHPIRHKPSVKTYIDISLFTELDVAE